MRTSIKRKDITGSSFSFSVAPNGDDWVENEDGSVLRTITEFSSLGDVGPVTFPAYADTTTAARAKDDFLATLREVEAGALAVVEQVKIEHEHRGRVMQMASRG